MALWICAAGQSFDDAHLPMAVRAMCERRLVRHRWGIRFLTQEGSAERKQVSPVDWQASRNNECAADPLAKCAARETQELRAGESHGSLLAAMGVILPSKSHMRVIDRDDSVVGYGHRCV